MIMAISEKGKDTKLYIAHEKDNRWTMPVYLGNIIHEDMSGNFPYITADGKCLIFTKAFSQFYILPTKVFLEEKHSSERK